MIVAALLYAQARSAQFVPFVSDENMLLFKMNITAAANVIQKLDRVVVFLHDRTNEQSRKAKEMLSEAIPIFSEQLFFIELDSNRAEPLIEAIGASAPHLLFYANHTMWSHFQFPVSETALLYSLNLFTEGRHTTVHCHEDFLKGLGTSHYTLLYPFNNTKNATHFARFGAISAGFIDLLPYGPNLATELNLTNGQLYLFRLEDVSLIPIEDNVSLIKEYIKPDFKRISPSDFTAGTGLIFGVMVNSLFESAVNVLEAVAEENIPNLTVGFIDRALHEVANVTVGQTISQFPSLVLFSNEIRQYYEIPTEINNKFREGEDIHKSIIDFLRNLPDPTFPSEPIPEPADEPVIRLVGKTHNDFAQTEGIDSVIYYESEANIQNRRLYRIFENVALEFKKTNNKIQFGVINATLNAANFPIMPVLPHIHIFPGRNKTDDRTFYGQANRNDFVRFINKYGSNLEGVDAPEAHANELSLELIQLCVELRSLDEDGYTKARERLIELTDAVNVSLDQIDQIVNEAK